MRYDAVDVAKFFIDLDSDSRLFPHDDMQEIDGILYDVGSLRLNIYLHLAQNLYIAKYGKRLFNNDIFACATGGVVKDVKYSYQALFIDLSYQEFDDNTEEFLKLVFRINENAPLNELIGISREDPEWVEKYTGTNATPVMDSLNKAKEYEEQYADALYVMDKLKVSE